MMANADKCHLLLSFVEVHVIEINGFTFKNSNCEKFLGVHFDDQHEPVKETNLNEYIL